MPHASARPTEATGWRWPKEASILGVLLLVVLAFEVIGWIHAGQSFILNRQRLLIIVLQMAVVGIMAVGVAQVIIMGGIDLSAGSVLGIAGLVAATLAQVPGTRAFFPALTDLPVWVPVLAGLGVGAALGLVNGTLIAATGMPPFIATLAMLVIARGLARLYTSGSQQSNFADGFLALGSYTNPVVTFAGVALLFHLLLTRTVYGRRTYAIGSNERAARMAGIDVGAHKVLVYSMAGLLYGLAAVIQTARAQTAQASTGTLWELDAISAAVIGGTSLLGGRGSILGVVTGVLILGVITSGFNFLDVGVFFVALVKGTLIVAVVVADRTRTQRRRGSRKRRLAGTRPGRTNAADAIVSKIGRT